MSYKSLAFCFVFATLLGGCASSGDAVLNRLAKQLAIVRSHQPRLVRCPRHLDLLIGMNEQVILAKLGKPDVSEGPKHVYLFTAVDPSELWQVTHNENGLDTISVPGGIPTELALSYSPAGTVIEVDCHLSG